MARKSLDETSPFRNGQIPSPAAAKRAAWRNEVRAAVPCPTCGADRGAMCLGGHAIARLSIHQERIEAWERATGRTYHPAWQERKRKAQAAKRRQVRHAW